MTASILEVEHLSCGYNGHEVLHDLTFLIERSQFAAIAGPNGAGKSTLLRVLAGLIRPSKGFVRVAGQPPTNYARRRLAQIVAVIFQDFSSPYEFSVFDVVALGRSPYISRWRFFSSYDHVTIRNAMEMTEILHLQDRPFSTLSGGEKQRVIIAKALAQEPTILLLDEPATHLDIHHQINTFNILERLNREKQVTIICITHDLTLASQYIDRLLLLGDGYLFADGPPQIVVRKDLLESLFQTPLAVGLVEETHTPYVCPINR